MFTSTFASASTARTALFAAAAAALIAVGAAARAGDLTVEVQGIKSAQGEIAVGLFDQADQFPKQVAHGLRLVATKDSVVAVFKDLKPGTYAISAYHDENDNKKLDRGLFGIPKEPYGFSQEARGEGGPPQFRDAQFEVPADGGRVLIKLR